MWGLKRQLLILMTPICGHQSITLVLLQHHPTVVHSLVLTIDLLIMMVALLERIHITTASGTTRTSRCLPAMCVVLMLVVMLLLMIMIVVVMAMIVIVGMALVVLVMGT